MPQQVATAASVEHMLWDDLHKELHVCPASIAAAPAAKSFDYSAALQAPAAAAGLPGKFVPASSAAAAAAAAGGFDHNAALQAPPAAAAVAPADYVCANTAAAGAAAAGGFDYSSVDYTNEESLKQLEQMIELEIMQALLQSATAAGVPAVAAAAPPAAAAANAQAFRLQRSAALLDQFAAVTAELQQLQAEMAQLQGDMHLQGQQQQQPGVSLASSWDAWGVGV
jgi:hypothetical protein